ncbi:MAG TPA: carboxypeptidase regulatory-like domain-containing protein [Vicinamibacterales bacterium]|nr:carboxypeptidase regulatory-like domain-containing protein [Vicinamibacterales bacterium]
MSALLRRLLLSTGVLVALSSVAFAQGHVTGTVRDADGKPLKGATITAENPDAAPSTFTGSSDAKGRFSLLGLRGGTWKVTVQAPGFVSETATLTTRSLGPNPTLDVVLRPTRDLAPSGPLQGIAASSLQQQLDAAGALASSGKNAEAIAAYRQIASRVPALTSIHLAVGALLERQHDYDGARAEYKALLEAEPDNTQAKAALDNLDRSRDR